MDQPIWQLQMGDGPFAAAAVHDGHTVRDELLELLAIPESDRLREEDPFTGMWTSIAPTRIVGLRSRFEVDLNRPREKAVYRTPEDSWGLQVWKGSLPDDVAQRSLSAWETFYHQVQATLSSLVDRQPFGGFNMSGSNAKAGGPDYLRLFMEMKSVAERI